MLAVVGTIPDRDFPLVANEVRLEDDRISIQGKRAIVNRGTPALLAAAIKTGEVLGQPPPFGYMAGDIGPGVGSQRLYEYLTLHLEQTDFRVITFHYIQPIVHWHDRVLFVLEKMSPLPILVADAGSMYVAKMSGLSSSYDLFTPDVGELAFLADEEAPHPFYTRGFILHEDNRVPELIARAYAHENASRYLLVKGAQDYLATQQGIQETVDYPMEETLEAIGGTGDTLTGIVSSLISSGMEVGEAAIVAAKANRLAGYYVNPTPATQVIELINQIPRALGEVLNDKKIGSSD